MPRLQHPPVTKTLTALFIAVLLGLALARWVGLPPRWAMCLVGVAIVLTRFRNTALLLLLAVLVGMGRGTVYMAVSERYRQLFGQPVVLQARADGDAVYSTKSQLNFDVTRIRITRPRSLQLAGRIRVEGSGVSMVYRGDWLQIEGKLSPTKGAAQARLSFARLTLLRRGHSPVDDFRRRFIAGLQSALPEPEASFGAGILIGQRSTIPKDVGDQLSVTGLTHLVAVSGYNLTIIIMAAARLFGNRSKFQSTVASLALVVLFIVITGLSASIVRAALVSMLSLLATYYGRQLKPLVLLLLAAAVTAFWNPFYLWADIGWYLSFLAFFGVLLVAPLLVGLLTRGKRPKLISGLVGETVSAQIMTLPIIMYIFGRVSLIGLLANILVVPLVPLAMLLSLLTGLAGMIAAAYAGWVAIPARFLLTYMIDLTGILSKVPHAATQHTISLRSMLSSYVVLLVFIVILSKVLTRQEAAKMVE